MVHIRKNAVSFTQKLRNDNLTEQILGFSYFRTLSGGSCFPAETDARSAKSKVFVYKDILIYICL